MVIREQLQDSNEQIKIYGNFTIKVVHLNVAVVWVLLTLVSMVSINQMSQSIESNEVNENYHRLASVLAAGVLGYDMYVIICVYRTWTVTFDPAVQPLQMFPASLLLIHSFVQVHFLVRKSRIEANRFFSAVNFLFNIVMLMHFGAFRDLDCLFTSDFFSVLRASVAMFEILHRVIALVVFFDGMFHGTVNVLCAVYNRPIVRENDQRAYQDSEQESANRNCEVELITPRNEILRSVNTSTFQWHEPHHYATSITYNYIEHVVVGSGYYNNDHSYCIFSTVDISFPYESPRNVISTCGCWNIQFVPGVMRVQQLRHICEQVVQDSDKLRPHLSPRHRIVCNVRAEPLVPMVVPTYYQRSRRSVAPYNQNEMVLC